MPAWFIVTELDETGSRQGESVTADDFDIHSSGTIIFYKLDGRTKQTVRVVSPFGYFEILPLDAVEPETIEEQIMHAAANADAS